MIGYIRGTVSHVFTEFCFIETAGVGYRIYIPDSTRHKLVAGNSCLLFTYLHVREDAMLLYGFYTQDEYDLFMILLSVNGVGPKLALGILSSINPSGFRAAVSSKNSAVLTKIPGVGKKTAERMILELKDKIGNSDEENGEETFIVGAGSSDGAIEQAMMALQTLGYSQAEIAPVLKKLSGKQDNVEVIIKQALKDLSRI